MTKAAKRRGRRLAELGDEGFLAEASPADRVWLASSAHVGRPAFSDLARNAPRPVRAALAENPAATRGQLDVLVADPDRLIAEAVARRSDCTQRHRTRLLVRQDGAWWPLLDEERTTTRQLRRIALVKRRWDVDRALLARGDCPARLVWKFALFPKAWSVRVAAAASPAAPALLLRILGRSRKPIVRTEVAGNERTPVAVVARLARDTNPWVSLRALGNPVVLPSLLTEAGVDLDQPAWRLRTIASNPACPSETADALLTWLALGAATGDPRWDPVTCIGDPTAGDVSVLDWYRNLSAGVDVLRHPVHAVRLAGLRSRPRQTASTLAALAQDPSWQVRSAVARFEPLPRRTRDLLGSDELAWIADTARQRKVSSSAFVRPARRVVGWVPGERGATAPARRPSNPQAVIVVALIAVVRLGWGLASPDPTPVQQRADAVAAGRSRPLLGGGTAEVATSGRRATISLRTGTFSVSLSNVAVIGARSGPPSTDPIEIGPHQLWQLTATSDGDARGIFTASVTYRKPTGATTTEQITLFW